MAGKNQFEDPYERLANKHMCYYDSVESVRQSRALSERNRPGLFS